MNLNTNGSRQLVLAILLALVLSTAAANAVKPVRASGDPLAQMDNPTGGAQTGIVQTDGAQTGGELGTHAIPGVRSEDGVLVFRDTEVYEYASARLQDMSQDEANRWEASMGFVSQRRMFDQVVDAEYARFILPYENLSEAELGTLAPPTGHSAAYRRALAAGIIQEVGDTYESVLAAPALARVVNARGFVAIGDKVLQVKGATVKTWPAGSFDRLDELDRATDFDALGSLLTPQLRMPSTGNTTDGDTADRDMANGDMAATAGNVSVGATGDATLGLSVLNGFGPFGTKSTGWVTSGNRRGSMDVTFNRTWVYPSPFKYVITKYDVNVKSQKKNFWGSWNYATCPNEVWISGSWTTTFNMIYTANLSSAPNDVSNRSFSYPHPNCINNFNGSFAPKAGTNLPYPSQTTYTAPTGKAFTEVSITPMTWSASVPGGSSGIVLKVTN